MNYRQVGPVFFTLKAIRTVYSLNGAHIRRIIELYNILLHRNLPFADMRMSSRQA